MAGPGTMTAAFAHFGIHLSTPLQVWSAVAPDGKTVALALWRDRFEGTPPTDYHERKEVRDKLPSGWIDLRGNRNRRAHLAIIGVGGRFRVVLATAKNTMPHPRKGADWAARPDLDMEITYINKETGQFGAKIVGGVL